MLGSNLLSVDVLFQRSRSRLLTQRAHLCAREAFRHFGDEGRGHLLGIMRHLPKLNRGNLLARWLIRKAYVQHAVYSPRAQHRRVNSVRPVRRRDDDYIF
eukprot:CAMPEP_0185275630 /NCGR_PEP_ID=MMETSP1359-20130426/54401_1 /TAXON_ID=552665 /ORGANISM="Bigelowiella longifila, Strain CCMP242" /LENGTH=99 /DNA_ID=CAMNT_0027869041 /DNA_START=152 /DNA_END=451 /DNA_ORIENTATION=-